MLKMLLALCLTLSLLSGCVMMSQIRTENRQKLLSLESGMSKQDVLSVMGTKTIVPFVGPPITNPYRTEMHSSNGRAVELLFYYTDIKKGDRAITDDELTPLVLIDGRLDGWGWSYWKDLIQKFELRIR